MVLSTEALRVLLTAKLRHIPGPGLRLQRDVSPTYMNELKFEQNCNSHYNQSTLLFVISKLVSN